jgi:hypothetical protein
MKDPADAEAYATYIGTKIKSSLIVPAPGEPGLALALLFDKGLVISGKDILNDDADCIHLKIDELMAIILATERLKDAIGRRYQNGPA